MNAYRHTKRAFTLIELLVVVVIIGLLTTLATSSYLKAQKRARDNTRKADISAIATAIESYYSIKKSFPGKDSGTPASEAINCESGDGASPTQNIVYYYFPLTVGATDNTVRACNDRQTGVFAGANNALKASFAPFPNWIPGLSDYINPIPVDKSFQGANGSATGSYQSLETASDTGANKTRTYVYRHLNGGYAVYTRLENSDTDGNIVTGTISSAPKPVNGTWSVTGTNIYMIRK